MGGAVGVAVNMHDRIVCAVFNSATVAAVGAAMAHPMPTNNMPAEGFGVTLLNGRIMSLPPPKAGWARSRRLPHTAITADMYR